MLQRGVVVFINIVPSQQLVNCAFAAVVECDAMAGWALHRGEAPAVAVFGIYLVAGREGFITCCVVALEGSHGTAPLQLQLKISHRWVLRVPRRRCCQPVFELCPIMRLNTPAPNWAA